MSKNQVADRIRSKQSTIKTQRTSKVPHVQRSQQETQEIQQFIRAVFTKENLWFIRQEDQENILATLQEINQLNSDLQHKCRSFEIFQRQATLFITMSERVVHLCHCVHFCLDYGFYQIEPRGLRLTDAIEASWRSVTRMRDFLVQEQRWPEISDPVRPSAEQAQFVQQQIQQLEPIAQKLLNEAKLQDVTQRLTVAELQLIYHFFSGVQKINMLQEQVLWAYLKQAKPALAKHNLPQLYQHLDNVQRHIQQLSLQMKDMPEQQRSELQQLQQDFTLKLYDLYVPLEPYRLVDARLKGLQQAIQKNPQQSADLLARFRQQCITDMKYIHLITTSLSTVGQTLQQVQSILFNLSIAFGKIYDNANPRRMQQEFLLKALSAISNLLERGDSVAKSQEKVTWQLQNEIEGKRILHPSIEEGLVSALRLLRDGRDEMASYARKLNATMERLNQTQEIPSLELYALLDRTYQERGALSEASFAFGNVFSLFLSIVNYLRQTSALFPKGFGSAQSNVTTEVKEMQRLFAAQAGVMEQRIHESWEGGRNIVWMLDRLLMDQLEQTQRFHTELDAILEPVRLRLASAGLHLAQENDKYHLDKSDLGEPIQVEAGSAARFLQDAPARSDSSKRSRDAMRTARKVGSHFRSRHEVETSEHDPFEATQMRLLMENLSLMKSSQAKQIEEVLTKAEAFNNYIEHVGRDYDPEEPEGELLILLEEMGEAETLWEVLRAIVKAKVLAYGMFNEQGNPLDYDGAKGDFMTRGHERHIRLAYDTFVTAKGFLERFINAMLGRKSFDSLSNCVPAEVLRDLEDMFLLPFEEQKIISTIMPS